MGTAWVLSARLELALRARDADVRPARDLRWRRRLRLPALALPSPRRRPGRLAAPPLALPDRSQPVTLIGRGGDCDVVVGDPTVSRHHAALILFTGRCFVLDRDSANGTWLNGRRVLGSVRVRPGDELRLGPVTFRLVRSVPNRRPDELAGHHT